MSCIFGSARHDEDGNYTGGTAGDQTQALTNGNDFAGECSMQTGYVHSKGWVILRPNTDDLANRLAYAMQRACNNAHIGYDQNNRLGIMTYGVDTTTDTECDCSTLVRACLKACGITVGNFITVSATSSTDAASVIVNSGYFTKVAFTSLSAVKTGDILVTKTKGHIVICIQGVSRSSSSSSTSSTSSTSSSTYYSKYTGSSSSIVTALKAVGETDTSFTHRKKIATANSISNYKGTAAQNRAMLNLLKKGKLIKA